MPDIGVPPSPEESLAGRTLNWTGRSLFSSTGVGHRGPEEQNKADEPRGGDRLIASNRKAYHDYFVDETLEAGLVLVGSEIKSIRADKVNLRDSYVAIRDGRHGSSAPTSLAMPKPAIRI